MTTEPRSSWSLFNGWLFPSPQVVGAVCSLVDTEIGFDSQVYAWLHRCVPVQKGASNDAKGDNI